MSKPDDILTERSELHKHNRSAPRRHRVLALINPVLHCRATCAQLIEADVNLVGIVEADTKSGGLPLLTLRRLLKKQGVVSTASQVAARLIYQAQNRKADRRIYERLFDRQHVEEVLQQQDVPVIRCRSYSEPSARQAMAVLQPDVLVVHSQSWVPRDVRHLPTTGLVLGGHPGLTPFYRGSHSSFWALLNQQPQMIGWTAFHVDKGVDTGDVVVQGRLNVQPDDSYMTLSWRGMSEIAKAQAAAIRDFDRTGRIPRMPHQCIPPESNFGLPGLWQYVKYMSSQNVAR
ncbi:MAG: formyltransferase family protein [Fuerstiella sp.]|nr:formyltransferase family protein [Fuerstiella sp.]